MSCDWYSLSTARIDSRVPPTQDKCGAACSPAAMISRTVSSVPFCVLPPAPKVTEKYLGCSSESLARVARSFSAPSAVLGGKNSMLKLGASIWFFQEDGGQGPGNHAVQQSAADGRPEAVDVEAVDQLRGEPEHEAVDDEVDQAEDQGRDEGRTDARDIDGMHQVGQRHQGHRID